MFLKVKDIEDIMEDYAPEFLKEDYDNVGLMVGDKEAIVTKILIALDCTMDIIDEAKEKGCNFILNHHPLLFIKPKTITMNTLVGEKIINLIKNDINVYASHTNLDSTKGGINDIATEILGFDKYTIIEPVGNCNNGIPHFGLGRLVMLDEPISLDVLCDNVKKAYNTKYIRYVGKGDDLIKTIAIINGSGEDFFEKSIEMGANCIITGDTKYHAACNLLEEKVAIIDAGHFASEWTPFKIFGEKFKNILLKNGYNNEVVFSEKTFDPYKIK
ncbi:MAG: Nif3-like dinuclear metal center hexameric protein [Clostridium sp.]|uniref:Nif3-like dinuclear metal center hexameric protein n=1 Tax=Clostridium sp. TaxID=1506 RepID=UPI003D6D0BB9